MRKLTCEIHIFLLHFSQVQKKNESVQVPRASLMAQRLKRLPAMRETWVRSLGWEDPLEKEMATHSSILARGIPWTEEAGGLQSTGSQRIRHDFTFTLDLIGTKQPRENSKQ